MVMRHFGGGIGHPRSALPGHLQHDDHNVSEEDVGQDTMLDEDGGADDSKDGDSEMETSSSASSSAEDDETDLDTDDNGYDSL
jgi:hypothetical protein